MELILGSHDLLSKHQRNPGRNNETRKCPLRFLTIDKFKPEVMTAIKFIGRAKYVEGEKYEYIYLPGKEPSSIF